MQSNPMQSGNRIVRALRGDIKIKGLAPSDTIFSVIIFWDEESKVNIRKFNAMTRSKIAPDKTNRPREKQLTRPV
jgi:hypothetical protein